MSVGQLRDEAIIEGQCLTMVHRELEPLCQKMVGAQTRSSTPNANENVIHDLAKILQELRQIEVGFSVEPLPGDKQTLRQATQAYTLALIELDRIDDHGRHAGGDHFQPYDPAVFLDAYFDARHLARQVCPTIDQIRDPALLRTDAYLPMENACENLQSHEAQVQSRVHFMQWVPAYKPDDVVYASVAYVDNTLRRPGALAGYETFYSMMDYSVGYMVQMHGGPWLTGSGVPIELGLSHIAGAMENNGSRQTELAIRAGWRQELPYHFFVQPKLSVGNAWHALNYGEGLEPKNGNSIVFGGNVVAGYSLPIQTLFTIDRDENRKAFCFPRECRR